VRASVFSGEIPVVMGYPGHYSAGTNSFTTVEHFTRVVK
jgi:hypothetical protein